MRTRARAQVEMPAAGLESVAGDGEGQGEMTRSLELLRRFLLLFQADGSAATTRVLFPDEQARARRSPHIAPHLLVCRLPCSSPVGLLL